MYRHGLYDGQHGDGGNFVSWEAGSVLPEGTEGQMGSEHMYSFDHAYRISAVRDWLIGKTDG